MERRLKVDGDRDLLTCETGGDCPRTAGGNGCSHAYARTSVGGTESSLLSYVVACSASRLAPGAHSRSHDIPDARTLGLEEPRVFLSLKNRNRPARRRQPKPKEEDCGTSTGYRAVS
jgi:hypothetical protein